MTEEKITEVAGNSEAGSKAEATSGETENHEVVGAATRKKKGKKAVRQVAAGLSPGGNASQSTANQEEILKAMMNKLAIQQMISQDGVSSRTYKKDMGDHKFWNTQPVPKHDEKIEEDGPIEENTPHDQIRKEPDPLPKEFEWSTLDLNDEAQLKELYELLTSNYVEDDDAMFRFDYSGPFLKWALQPPGWKALWHIGVRVSSTKRLVAFISGIPADIHIHKSSQHLVEINFLCVHKKLRSKRHAPVLIKEVTRRTHLQGIFQAVYTAGVILPKPVATARYFHRSLNPKKLVETNFSKLPANTPLSRMIKKFKLPGQTLLPGLRPMVEKDVGAVRGLLNRYMKKFRFVPVFRTDADIRHWLLPKEGVIWSYVVEDPTTKTITDFFSFYSLNSSVINNSIHKTLHAAYLFYYAIKSASDEDEKAHKARLQALIKDALIIAKNNDFDVFNCLNLMENAMFIEDLKFGPGDGHLNYYMYNWRCRAMGPEDVGVVML